MVFQDQKALADLNAITHKYVAQKPPAALRRPSGGVPAVGIDAIALLESPLAATIRSYPGHHRAGGTPGEADHGPEGISRLCPDAGGGPEAQCLVPGAL